MELLRFEHKHSHNRGYNWNVVDIDSWENELKTNCAYYHLLFWGFFVNDIKTDEHLDS